MKALKNFFKSIKPAVLRFPALFILLAACAVFSTLLSSAWEIFPTKDLKYDSQEWKAVSESRKEFSELITNLLKAGGISAIFSFFAGIAVPFFAKKFEQKKRTLFLYGGQILGLLLFLPAYFIFKDSSFYKGMAYCGLMAAMIFCSIYILMFEQEEKLVVPNLIVSEVIAGISAGCVCAGLFIIRYAVDLLLIKFNSLADTLVNSAIIAVTWMIVYAGIYVASITKSKEEITCPKAFKVIFLFILLPLYLALLLVLYGYFAKCLFTLSMPSGKINWFVSFATAFYLVFYFSVRQFEEKAANFFCKRGAVILIPLIVIQCLAFGIRINAYGFTPSRYASLLYILFSMIFVTLSFVKGGKWMSAAFPLFAGLCLFATITPMNLADVPQRNQYARIDRIYKKAGLLIDGKYDIQNAAKKLEPAQKAQIVDSYDAIVGSESKIRRDGWPAKDKVSDDVNKEKFEKLFGFAYSKKYGKEPTEEIFYRFNFDYDKEFPVNIQKYSELYRITNVNDADKKIVITWADDRKTDITQEIMDLLKEVDEEEYSNYKEKPGASIVLKQEDGYAYIFTSLSAKMKKDKDGKIIYFDVYGSGFVCK